MTAIHSRFTKIIDGTTQFLMPVFQRDHRWAAGQCEQLWSDILLIARDPSSRQHFLGSDAFSLESPSRQRAMEKNCQIRLA
jgi:hypothetical protein